MMLGHGGIACRKYPDWEVCVCEQIICKMMVILQLAPPPPPCNGVWKLSPQSYINARLVLLRSARCSAGRLRAVNEACASCEHLRLFAYTQHHNEQPRSLLKQTPYSILVVVLNI